MRQASRVLAGILAAGAFAGGSAALAGDGPGDRSARRQAFAPTLVFTLDPASAALHGNPEGVAYDPRSRAFFVSRVGTGAIFRGTRDDPSRIVKPFIAGAATRSDAPLATGLKVRAGKLYVAGATTGTIKIYDIATAALLRTIDTHGADTTAPTFVNDLDVTGDGDIFATDSFRPAIYRVDGHTGALTTIDVSAKIPLVRNPDGSPAFNLNGIEARGNDELVVVQTATSKLFRIDLGDNDGDRARRRARARAVQAAPDIDEITLRGGTTNNGDGLLFDRGRLIVVQGTNPKVAGGAKGVLTFIKLRRHRTRGTVEEHRTDTTLAGPATMARARNRYLVVNANFAGPADGPFTVSALDRGSARRGGGRGGGNGRRG